MAKGQIFDKESSIAVKGLAILLMIVYHLFAFPGRNGDLLDADFLGNRFTHACGVCVSIYVLVAGYANELMYEKFQESLWKRNLIGIRKLYLKFLSVAIPILAVVYVFDLSIIPNYGSTCQISSDLDNLLMGG